MRWTKTNIQNTLLPIVRWWPLVNRQTLHADMLAGITGAIIVLPQGVAFAMIAGLPPQYGLYTAIITPIVAALFGSSRHLISGPTTAISIVVFTAISHHAEPGTPEFIRWALTLTFLAGVYQFAFGVARLGTLTNFVSHSVVVGFTAGAAILIATSQLKHVLGVTVPSGESFLHIWVDIFHQLKNINSYVLAIALTTLVVAILAKRLLPRWPNMLIAMVVGSILGVLLHGETHGVSYVGALPAHLPPLSLPDFSITTIRQLATEAFGVALLGLIEAVSIARSIATRSQQRINGNQEFIGQGLSNIVGSFFSSYAGSGSFTRSGINYQTGAQTPLSSILAALFLALILLLFAPLTAYLPIAAMGGIILVVAYGLIDFRHIRGIVKASKSETIILLVTFCATLFLELEFAIYAGILLSLVFYLNRTSRPKIFSMVPDLRDEKRRLVNLSRKTPTECPQLKIIRIDGSFFFGAVHHISQGLQHITDVSPQHKHLLVLAYGINFIDVSGAEMLIQEARRWRVSGGALYLCGLKTGPREFLHRAGYLESLGKENLFNTKADAIATVFRRLDTKTCTRCNKWVFKECNAVSRPSPLKQFPIPLSVT